MKNAKLRPNKRMQSDLTSRYAPCEAADAERYEGGDGGHHNASAVYGQDSNNR